MKIASLVRIKFLPAVLAGLSLFACEDQESTTTVSGRVINFGSRQPIEGAIVQLKDGVGSDFFGVPGNTSSDKRNETVTDANGEFTVSLTGEHGPALGVSKEGYDFNPDWNSGVAVGVKLYGRGGGEYQNEVFEMKAQAGFNPIFKSTVPVEPTDSLIIFSDYTKPDVPANELKDWLNTGWNHLYIGQQTSRFVPGAPAEELTKLTTGDTYTPYQIAYTRDGQWYTKIDSVYIKSFEVYTDTIYY